MANRGNFAIVARGSVSPFLSTHMPSVVFLGVRCASARGMLCVDCNCVAALASLCVVWLHLPHPHRVPQRKIQKGKAKIPFAEARALCRRRSGGIGCSQCEV